MRSNNRAHDELRPFTIERNFQPQADASILIKMGNTHVICSVTVENSVPPFLRESGQGWITAEYGMLPCSTNRRMGREAAKGRSGRTYEIQRLIGRSLRMMLDLNCLGEKTIRVDCDVLNADGGTRTASITGAALAVRDALITMQKNGELETLPAILPLAAISVGIVDGQAMLDLDYQEDSRAEADANFIMTDDGRLVEAQSTAEGQPFSRDELDKMVDLAEKGTQQLFELWLEK